LTAKQKYYIKLLNNELSIQAMIMAAIQSDLDKLYKRYEKAKAEGDSLSKAALQRLIRQEKGTKETLITIPEEVTDIFTIPGNGDVIILPLKRPSKQDKLPVSSFQDNLSNHGVFVTGGISIGREVYKFFIQEGIVSSIKKAAKEASISKQKIIKHYPGNPCDAIVFRSTTFAKFFHDNSNSRTIRSTHQVPTPEGLTLFEFLSVALSGGENMEKAIQTRMGELREELELVDPPSALRAAAARADKGAGAATEPVAPQIAEAEAPSSAKPTATGKRYFLPTDGGELIIYIAAKNRTSPARAAKATSFATNADDSTLSPAEATAATMVEETASTGVQPIAAASPSAITWGNVCSGPPHLPLPPTHQAYTATLSTTITWENVQRSFLPPITTDTTMGEIAGVGARADEDAEQTVDAMMAKMREDLIRWGAKPTRSDTTISDTSGKRKRSEGEEDSLASSHFSDDEDDTSRHVVRRLGDDGNLVTGIGAEGYATVEATRHPEPASHFVVYTGRQVEGAQKKANTLRGTGTLPPPSGLTPPYLLSHSPFSRQVAALGSREGEMELEGRESPSSLIVAVAPSRFTEASASTDQSMRR
jgi:hypothetical protein